MDSKDRSASEIRGIIAFIGIGSNMGKPAEACREAIGMISEIPKVKLLRTSSLYRTEPVGFQNQPSFINAVSEIRTALEPRQLFEALKEIERKMGRSEGPKWGPRVIDLDILLYGQEVVRDKDIVIPHPELHKRAFVLVPLCELACYAIHPVFGISVHGLMDRSTDSSRVDIYDKIEAK